MKRATRARAPAMTLRSLLLALLALAALTFAGPASGSKLRALHTAIAANDGDGGEVFGAHADADPTIHQLSESDLAAAAAVHAGAPATFAPYEQQQPPGTVIHHTVAHVPHAAEENLHTQEHQAEMHDAVQHAQEQQHEQGHDDAPQRDHHDEQQHESGHQQSDAHELPEHEDIQVAKAPQSQFDMKRIESACTRFIRFAAVRPDVM